MSRAALGVPMCGSSRPLDASQPSANFWLIAR